jgi:hypothetical protein
MFGCASASFRSWNPRSPAPINPMRIRSFAPSARAVGSVAASANPLPACPRNSRRVVIDLLSLSSLSEAKNLQFV